MNEYIFYKRGEDSKLSYLNCLVLGKAFGNNAVEARQNFLKNNSRLIEKKYNPSDIIAKQVLTDKQISDIKKIIEYLWADEKKHYEELYSIDLDDVAHMEREDIDENHIFSSLNRLKVSLVE